MANIKAVSGYRNLEAEIRNVLDFINRMKGGNSVTFKDGVIDTLEPCNPDGVPNFAGLKLGKVGQNKFNLTVENKFTFANENYIEGYDGRGFFLGFDDFDNYTSSLLEVDNVTIRGSLLARQFIIDTWKYRAGNTIQGAGGAVVSNTDGSTWATFEDPLGNSGEFFIADDVIMCQEVDRKGVTYDGNGDVVDDSYLIKRLIFKVDSVVSGVVTFTSVTGAPGNKATISKGDEFVILYNESDSTRGNIIGYMTNVSDGPYIYMKEGITDWAGWSANDNVSLVLGNLDFFSVTDFPAMTGFGLYAENVYLTGHISLANNGYISLGKTAYNDTTNAGIWMGDSDATATINPYFYLGSALDAKYMKVDTTAGTFETLGFTITGGTIQTATSGQRVVIASNKITFYDAASNVGELYGFSGDLYNTGRLTAAGGFYVNQPFTLFNLNSSGLEYGNPSGKIFHTHNIQFGSYGGSYDVTLYRDAASVLKTDGVFDAITGFRVNGSATSGYFLRGNGTNCVLSLIQETDIHALAMSWTQTHDWGGRCTIAASDGDINTDGLVDSALYVNADDGFKYNGGATSGYYLRGNGTYFVSSAIQSGDLPSHTHSASNITSGTLDIARGGTGASSWTANRVVVVNSVGSALTSSSITTTHIGALGTGLSATKVWSTTYNDHTVVILYGAIQSWTIT